MICLPIFYVAHQMLSLDSFLLSLNWLEISSLYFYILLISVTSSCSENTVHEVGIKSWPIWTCDARSFDWTYDDKETCLLLEGEVTVTPDGGEPVKRGEGDLVVFPAGMSCRWDVHKAVCKHYQFGD